MNKPFYFRNVGGSRGFPTGGAWSIGATDKNLLDYIADISYQYLYENYSN